MMSRRNLISPQYLRLNKIAVSLIKVNDPANFIVKECSSAVASPESLKFIEAEEVMQRYYNSIETPFFQLPLKDAIVVVLVEGKFFRAQVRSILNTTAGYIFKVYLLDYGKEFKVSRACLYEINPDFLVYPFQAVCFKLIDIEPISLVISSKDMALSYGPVDSWDPSSISYLEDIRKALDYAYIVVKGIEKGCLVGSLYVHLCNGEIKCINEDLVEKKFARCNPNCTEKVISLETCLKYQHLESTQSFQQSVRSSASAKSAHSTAFSASVKTDIILNGLPKDTFSSDGKEHSLRQQSMDLNKKIVNLNDRNTPDRSDLIRRKMTGSIAVDIDKLNRDAKESLNQSAQSEVSNKLKNLKRLGRSRQIKAEKEEEKEEESNSKLSPTNNSISSGTHRSTSKWSQPLISQESHNNQEHESKTYKEVKVDDINVCQSIHLNSMEKPLHTGEKTVEEKTKTPPLETTGSIHNSSNKKLEALKNLCRRKKFISPNTTVPVSEITNKKNNNEISVHVEVNASNSISKTKTAQETLIVTKKSDSEKSVQSDEISSKSKNLLEDLINDALSDIDDPDDLLQYALDPKKNKDSSSETETSSGSKSSSKISHFDVNVSLDFSSKCLWEKQKVPALSIGEAVPSAMLSVNETTFTPDIKLILKNINFYGPSCIQSVVWPSMNRCRNLTAIAPPHSGKTIAYMLPLISNLSGGTFYNKIPKGKGPIAIILCSSWKKVHAVYDFFRIFGGSFKIKILTFFADGKSKRNKVNAVTNGCDIIISLPSCLLELIREDAVDICRLCHFILDDGDMLLSRQIKEVSDIMLFFVEGIRSRPSLPIPLQLVVCAEKWTKSISAFVNRFMISPILLFSSFLELAVQAKVPMFGHLSLQSKKDKLLEVLQNTQRTVICTKSKETASDIHSYLKCESVRSYLVTEDMEHYISNGVVKDWKSVHLSSRPYCLVITDAALTNMPISDAKYLIHYEIPEVSRLQFGNRFSCIAESLQSKQTSDCTVHILISKECSQQAGPLLKIISRSGGENSEDLKLFVAQQKKILKSADTPLCNYFKAYGSCDLLNCELRHHIDSKFDAPTVVPQEGDIDCLVTHIFDATHYYIRVLKHLPPSEEQTNRSISMSASYAKIGFQLKNIYSITENQKKVISPIIGECYVLEDENELFFRVKVLDFVEAGNRNSKQIVLAYQDEGWVKTYNCCKLFSPVNDIDLPPPLAVEVYLCGTSPPDTSLDWNYQATHFIKNMISGKEVHGKIFLCLGDTLWLNPMILREKLISSNDYLNLTTLTKALIDNGFAVENKHHIPLLHSACEGKVKITKTLGVPELKICNRQMQGSYAFLDLNVQEDVYVSSVISPHQFYVQRSKFVDCLDGLLDDINDHVQKKLLKKCKIMQKGLYCIAPFKEDNRYYRAIITDVCSNNKEIQLLFVDFGDTGCSSSNSIYMIPKKFLLLPFQAIECELDGIRPSHGGWSDKTIDSFFDLTRDDAGDMKVLYLQANSKCSSYRDGNHYVIDLWNGEKLLSDQLLETGLVETNDRVPTVISSQSPAIEERFWDDIPPGYTTSSEDEDLDPEEKDEHALFCAVLAKIMLQGNKPPNDVEISEFVKDFKSNIPHNEIANDVYNSKQKVMEAMQKSSNKFSTFQAFKRLLKDSLKSQPKSLKSHITWWDTDDKLYVLIKVKNVKVYELDLHNNGFKFKTSFNKVEYHAEETFFSNVLSKEGAVTVLPDGLNIVLSKENSARWPRLIMENLKLPHIKYDLNHIDDSDSEDADSNNFSPKDKVEAVPYDSEEDEDQEFSDEETYIQPWRDLAEYKDPFNPIS